MTTDLFQPDQLVLHYRLLAPVRPGNRDLWRAEDTRNGRTVFLKVLSRSLPKDKGRRDALLSKLRQNGAFVHPAYPLVWEISPGSDDLLFMSTEWVDGESLSARVAGALPSRDEFLKWGWQLAEALAVMHKRDLVHGNFSGDNIVIDASGNLRLFGLGLAALSDRRERGDMLLLGQAGAVDLEGLSYKSPEEADGRAIDARSDIFSIGGILYLMGTGSAPFTGSKVADLTTAIVKSNPRNPRELNPDLPAPLLQLIGKCVFKNPMQRYTNGDALLTDIEKIEPKIRTMAAYPKAAKSEVAVTRTMANLVIAELPYYDLLSRKDPDRAVRLSAKMQQVVGEAVYLFDGEIIDSIGSRMVALVPDANDAVRAAHRALADLRENNATSDAVEPRLALHRGEILRRDRQIEGEAITMLGSLVSSLEPMQILVSVPLLKAAGIEKFDAAGEVSGVRFAHLPPELVDEPELVTEAAAEAENDATPARAQPLPAIPVAPPAPPLLSAGANEGSAGALDPADVEIPEGPPAAAPKRSMAMPMAAAVLIALLGGGAAVMMMRGKDDGAATPVANVASEAPKAAAAPRLMVMPLAVNTADAASTANAAHIAPAVAELLRQSGKVEIATTADPDALQLSVRPGTTPNGVIPQMSGKGEGPPVQLDDTGVATTQLVDWVGKVLNIPTATLISSQPGAMASFAEAVSEFRTGDAKGREAARQSIADSMTKDPNFIPAQRLAMEIYEAAGDRKGLMATATSLLQAQPQEHEIRLKLLTWQLEDGLGAEAISNAGSLLAAKPNDVLALQAVARQALCAGDAAAFGKAVGRLERAAKASDAPFIHRPDIFATAGDFDRATQMYYDIETREPANPALALKIGRIAAMRESWEIAEIELKKLDRLSPKYGAPVLRSYIAAQKKDAAAVERHLAQAIANAKWNDDVYTHAAEIYALMSQKTKVVEALENANRRGEANITMVLLKQPFFYIGYDGRSTKLRSDMEQRRRAIRTALNSVRL